MNLFSYARHVARQEKVDLDLGRNQYTDGEVRMATVHTRQDTVMIVRLLQWIRIQLFLILLFLILLFLIVIALSIH